MIVSAIVYHGHCIVSSIGTNVLIDPFGSSIQTIY
jgi:hypothetical protein